MQIKPNQEIKLQSKMHQTSTLKVPTTILEFRIILQNLILNF
jgi:hypothetical protein